jgi:hypothetical protein
MEVGNVEVMLVVSGASEGDISRQIHLIDIKLCSALVNKIDQMINSCEICFKEYI